MNISSLNTARQRLVQQMQRIHFGHIENLRIEHGDPVWHPPPRIIRDLIVGKHVPMRGPARGDFALKQRVTDLFTLFDERQELDIERLYVQDGLPFRIAIRETAVA